MAPGGERLVKVIRNWACVFKGGGCGSIEMKRGAEVAWLGVARPSRIGGIKPMRLETKSIIRSFTIYFLTDGSL